ncbi:MAG: WecB/TagA/CpsF family glycosyltransferase [Actinobacteria bacterium]|nr:WecB/TagA/CpsF family glycosyltransferase [Actinomycetota bacterium]
MPRDDARKAPGLATVDLFGLDFVSDASIDDVADALVADDRATAGWSCVATPNVDHIVRYRRHPPDREVAESASVVLPDGMPIVWTSRLVGRPIRRRLAGSDLFTALWRRIVAEQVPATVVAASQDVADRLLAEDPAVGIVVPPMFDLDRPDQVAPVVDDLVATCAGNGSRFLLICISADKSHHLAARLHERWGDAPGTPHVLLLGGSADLYLGLKPRAPEWMQRTGLEWLHRLAQEPRRLFRRYLVDDVTFLGDVGREWRRTRRSGPGDDR